MDIDIAVDAGGSRVRAHAYTGEQHAGHYEVLASGNPTAVGLDRALAAMEEAIDGLLKKLGVGRLGRIACGVAGSSPTMLHETLSDSLSRRYFAEVFVCTDLESLLESAAPEGPVTVVISGTGSVAAHRTAAGDYRRAGGTAPPGGDAGSGTWLATRAKVVLADCLQEGLSDFEIGPQVEKLAANGDDKARVLIESCAWSLIRLLDELKSEPGPLVVEGGLIANSSVFQREFIEQLSRELPHLSLKPGFQPAHWGALSLARKADHVEIRRWA